MACRFSDENGMCSLFEDTFNMAGVNENGVCICEDDPDPSLMCGEYEDAEE